MRRLSLALLALLAVPAAARAQSTPVTVWIDEADSLGEGNANWHGMAVMSAAMHDAVNAVQPRYARWSPAAPGEPPARGADPQVAMEQAAATVLAGLTPAQRDGILFLLSQRLAPVPPGPAKNAGIALGTAIGQAALDRRRNDGFSRVTLFPGSDRPGKWRPTPPNLQSSGTTDTRPFLFTSEDEAGFLPPPDPGSPRYLADVEQTRRLGGNAATDRTAAEADAAIFWAYQSTQRGFVHYAATIVEREMSGAPLADQARFMSQIAAAMADSAILVWDAKARWSFWRPVTAINTGDFGVPQDPTWQSFIETPPHPEYPSGHAADCYTGAGFIQAALGDHGLVTYTAQSAAASATLPAAVWTSDMGTPAAPVELSPVPRRFNAVMDAAQECADSRVWAGAHFPSANEESRRIAGQIVTRAMAAVPKIAKD